MRRSPSTELAEAEGVLRRGLGSRLRTGHPLAPLTSLRVGGPAALFVEAEREDDLAVAAEAVIATGLPWMVIGKGSNVLVADHGFEGLVLRLGRGFRWAAADGERIHAGAAMPLPMLAGTAASRGLSGLEFGVAIPGSVGGAVRMNAGAHGRSMSDVLETVELYSLEWAEARTIGAEEAGFAYRTSTFPRGTLVTAATATLRASDPARIRELMDEARAWRKATQPLAEPNCGSVFKNPPGDHAARLVESSGAKGRASGGAAVSAKHANFIVTRPGATAADVLRLIGEVRTLVRERFGVELETEVQLAGDFDRDPD